MNKSFAIAAAALVVALGMVFGAALWILAGVVVLATIGLSYAMANQLSGSIVVDRLGGDVEVKAGSRVPITVQIRNPTRWPIVWVLTEDMSPKFATQSDDTFAPSVTYQGQRLGVFLVPAGGEQQLEYQVDCRRRGYLQVGPTLVETGDLLGMFRRFHVAGQSTYITVLPEVYPINDYEIGSRRPIGEIRLRERAMEDPTRLRGIRRWQIGDPMRSVHWAATARTGELHSKIYEPSSIIGATLVLDLHTRSNPASQEPKRCDLAITAAASVAYYLLQQNEPFGLVTNGRDAADRLRHPSATSRPASRQTDDADWSETNQGDPEPHGNGGAKAYRRRLAARKNTGMRDENDRRRPIVIQPDKTPIHYRSMLSTMARLERSDALTLPELMVECESQLAADTTLIVLVQNPDEAALASVIAMKRRGRAVEVIANVHGGEQYAALAGPLSAQNIIVHHLKNTDSIVDLCRKVSMR